MSGDRAERADGGEQNAEPGRGSGDTAVAVDLLQRRLDNKSRRIARAIQFNIVAPGLIAGLLGPGVDGIRLSPVVWVGLGLLLVSATAALGGLYAVGRSVDGLHRVDTDAPYSDDPSLDRVRVVYERRDRLLGHVQTLSFATGASGSGVFLFGALGVLDVFSQRVMYTAVAAAVLCVVIAVPLGYLLGHPSLPRVSE